MAIVHHDGCFGCGPGRDCGLRLALEPGAGGALAGRFVVEQRHQGPPGLAHGGIVGAVLDEAMALVLHHERMLALTRRLEIDLLAAVAVGSELALEARVERRDGRKLWLAARADADAGPVAEARGLFLAVDGF